MKKYNIREKENKIPEMKFLSKKIMTILLIVSLCFSAVSWRNFFEVFAAVATYGRTDNGEWYYKIIDESKKAVSIRPIDLGAFESSKLAIPSSVKIQEDSYTIKEIAPYAYSQCYCADCLRKNKKSLSTAWEDEEGTYEGEEIIVYIDEVVIPSTVEEIGACAFEYCNIDKVTIEENSKLKTIGEDSFADCSLQNIKIPASVTNIEGYAFSYSMLETITFEEGINIEEIKEYTFAESELKEIVLPETVTKISEAAFLACELTTITIPAAVTNVGYYAFEANQNLTEVNFAENGALERIRMGAFMECDLKELTIPASVTTIGDCAFGNNYALKTVTFKTNSKVNKINGDPFAEIPEFDYEEDYIEDEIHESNISVVQVNVENYDVYKWIVEEALFDEDAEVYSANTRVFLDERKSANAQGEVTMNEKGQAKIQVDDYVTKDQGHHFENSKFEYSDTLNLEGISTKDIENSDFVSKGYPYVVIKANQEINEYEIAYDLNGGDGSIEKTKCKYDSPVTFSSNDPIRTGYEFLGWSKDAAGVGTIYQPGEVVNENFSTEHNETVTLYAVWKEITKKVTIHFSTPKNKASKYGFEIVVLKNGRTIQQYDLSSSEVGDKQITISGAKIGETYTIKCTNYEKNNGQKKYYQATTKEVTIQ